MRSSRVLAALVLALSLLGLAVPADAAGTGTLSIVTVDEDGAPMPGQLQVLNATGSMMPVSAQGTAAQAVVVPTGEYGVVSLTPWGGLLCAGIAGTCGMIGMLPGSVDLDGTVTVSEGGTTQVRIEGAEPLTLSGPARVGQPVEVEWSPGMENLINYFGMAGGGGIYSAQVQWLRNGQPIAGADEDGYVPGAADVGRRLSAQATYPEFLRSQFEVMSGAPVTPRTSNAIAVEKVRTKAFANLANPTVRAGRQGKVRVDVTAPDMFVTGQVKVVVGSWSKTAMLRNGSARLVLPVLAPGKHTVAASFLGSAAFAPSKAAPKTLTVEKG